MTCIKFSDSGILINHDEFIRETYSNCLLQSHIPTITEWTPINFMFKTKYFQLELPHIRQGANKIDAKKKRKRKLPLNDEEKQSESYHLSVSSKLQEAARHLTKIIFENGIPAHKIQLCKLQIIPISTCTVCSELFKNVCLTSTLQTTDNIVFGAEAAIHFTHKDIENRLVTYQGRSSRTMCLNNKIYLLPAKSSFLLSDLKYIEPLLQKSKVCGGFDIILLDPPWENKSVKRGKKYSWLSLADIKDLPLDKLMSEDSLIFVWVTNKQKFHKFIVDDFFPKYNINFLTEWHWLKVTRSGQPVFDFDSCHKRPYEAIIIGQTWKNECNRRDIKSKIIASIPCTIHSHKPPIHKMITDQVPDVSSPKCLELFARNLTPGWVSWGNEVLEMQHSKYFQAYE